jgi:hypothetical protein
MRSQFNTTGVSSQALEALARLEQLTGQAFNVNSAYRSPEHNAKVGGAKHSQHTHGNAFDIDVSNMSIEERQALIRQAQQSGFQGVGVYDNALHFDVGPRRHWGPSYGRESTPEWAMSVLGGGQPQQGGTQPQTRNALMQERPQMDRMAQMNMLMQAMPRYQNTLDVKDFLT